MQGIRDTLAGKTSAEAPGERLTGQNGWTEVAGCPLYTNDDFTVAMQQMEDILGKYPKLDAFVPTGGFPQFLPRGLSKTAEKVQGQDRLGQARAGGRRHAAGADRSDEEGPVGGQVGQRPFEMGYKVMYFLDMKEGKPAPSDPTYTGLDVCTPKNADTCMGG